MEIYLMQHGESYAKDQDPERSLTPQGEQQIHLSAKALKKMTGSFDLIITSPKKRARQTAEIIAGALEYPQESIEVTETLEPTVPSQDTLTHLAAHDQKNRIFLAGHLPSLANISSALVSEASQVSFHFEMGGIVRIDLEKIVAGTGTIRWLLTPGQLAALSGTE